MRDFSHDPRMRQNLNAALRLIRIACAQDEKQAAADDPILAPARAIYALAFLNLQFEAHIPPEHLDGFRAALAEMRDEMLAKFRQGKFQKEDLRREAMT